MDGVYGDLVLNYHIPKNTFYLPKGDYRVWVELQA